ncbi:MAG: hypothetical protein H6672_03070 [Anaerolineaceae bacterium]|nr:hypothetical protein [Anaerolineaceae bacterium]
MRNFWRQMSLVGIIVLITMVLVSGQASLQDEISGYPRDEAFELELITQLNQRRIRDGRVPLARNADLDYLAFIQAEYMTQYMPFTQVDAKTFDYHIDAFGEDVKRRADFIGWPAYGIPGQTYVSEIAAYYPSVDAMMDFWNSSLEHRTSIYQYGYREVGVAVLRYRDWRLAYVVFGGRPAVLPVLYWPDRNMLFLTADQSPFPERFVPAQVQIYNDQGIRLHDNEWLVWTPRMPLPAGATNNITVVYTNGNSEVVTDVDLSQARVFPSEPLVIATAAPTQRPLPTIVRPTLTPTVPPPTPTATMPPVTGIYDMRVEYNGQSLTIVNQSGHPLDIEPLALFIPNLNTVLDSDWLGLYSETSLTNFPSGYCIQVWSYEASYYAPPMPDDCVLRASGRSIVRLNQRFWLSGEFEMRYGEKLIASCRASAGVCAFDIPKE